MKAENRGKKVKKNRKLAVKCTICGADMACPESMRGADGLSVRGVLIAWREAMSLRN